METLSSNGWRRLGGVSLWIGVPLVVLAGWLWLRPGSVSGEALRPVVSTHPSHRAGDPVETAVFAGGCYWTLEAAFRDVDGVVATRVGTAGDAEAVEVRYNPGRVSYPQVLDTFMKNHDPALGAPAGGEGFAMQRSAIFIVNPEHTPLALEALARATQAAPEADPILTSVHALASFIPAPEHDQQYFEKRGRASRFTR